jgi:predicted dehydrogenase
VWNPDERRNTDFLAQWQEVPDDRTYDNGFKVQWEMFIRHLHEDAPFRWDLLAGARGVQLAELGMQSWEERRWIDVPALEG